MSRLAIVLIPLLLLVLVTGGIGCGDNGEPEPGPLRGSEAEAFDTDQEVMQLASATFYADVHAGFDPASNTWKNTVQEPGHYYPTKLGLVRDHVLVLSTSVYDPDNVNNPRIDETPNDAAETADIQDHAIWMGLLVNFPGAYTDPGTGDDRDAVAPLETETGFYLQEIPESAMAGNAYNGGPEPGGSYCWVVGKNGWVYGAYQAADGNWYSGFSGVYP